MYVTGGNDDYCNDDHVMIGDYIHNGIISMDNVSHYYTSTISNISITAPC